MNPLKQTPLQSFRLPFGQDLRLEEVEFEGGIRLLRLRIKEKSRFTILDLDPDTARAWGEAMRDWATDQTVPEDD